MFKTVLVTLFFLSSSAMADYPSSFSNAKSKAEKEVYFDKHTTFYCGCDFVFDDVSDLDGDGKTNETMVMPVKCGYVPRNAITSTGKPNERASRIEWEHIMPAKLIGGHLDEWQNKENYAACLKPDGKFMSGRDCAYKLNEGFRRAHDDMNNLVPAVGELNADRSDSQYANIPGEARAYGVCDFEVDLETDTAEPADSIKGDVARVYFHMIQTHNAHVDQKTKTQMLIWDRLDPVDAWECQRNERIAKSQGVGNVFVAGACGN
jgi:deoxyribonuclease-1